MKIKISRPLGFLQEAIKTYLKYTNKLTTRDLCQDLTAQITKNILVSKLFRYFRIPSRDLISTSSILWLTSRKVKLVRQILIATM